MQTLVLSLMILVCFNYILKQTFNTSRQVLVILLSGLLLLGLSWPFAIEQSKTKIADWLANPALMEDLAVILTADVCAQIAFCIVAVAAPMNCSSRQGKRKQRILAVLRCFPGLSVYPVFEGVLVAFIFSFPGISFPLLSWGMGIGMLVLSLLGILFLKWILPDKELRLELLFLTNVLVAILGVIATVNGHTAMKNMDRVDWEALAGLLLTVLLMAAGGYALYCRPFKRKQN